jgi:hypothetical protein
LTFAVVALVVALCAPAEALDAPGDYRVAVVATGIPRPAQLALTPSGQLVVLSHGWSGDSAAEIYWLDPAGPAPINAALAPRVVIPFAAGPRKMALGSLVVDPKSGDLYLGEENGNRIYRLTSDKRLLPLAVGLNHLLGGSSIALDAQGRLVVLDYASLQSQQRSETPMPHSLDWLAAEEYQGPLVFRFDPAADIPGPRQLALGIPFFPRHGTPQARGETLNRFIAVAAKDRGEIAVLTSGGEVLTISLDGETRRLARLPPGQQNRTSLAVAGDGSLMVSSGFHIRAIYRVAPDGTVTTVTRDLSDPQGIVVDRNGAIYVAETALHRIIRLVPTGR